jgi:hypothetical protein
MTREGGSQSLEAVKWTRQGEGRLHGGSRVHKRLWGEFCEGGIGGIFMGDANSLLGRRRKGGGGGGGSAEPVAHGARGYLVHAQRMGARARSGGECDTRAVHAC